MGNNLWYCDSLKYKYVTQKVRVTYAGLMLQSKTYFEHTIDKKGKPLNYI